MFPSVITCAVIVTSLPSSNHVAAVGPSVWLWIASAPTAMNADAASAPARYGLLLRKKSAAAAKRMTAATHQLGGRHAYLPIQTPAANASVAQSIGWRVLRARTGCAALAGREIA